MYVIKRIDRHTGVTTVIDRGDNPSYLQTWVNTQNNRSKRFVYFLERAIGGSQ